jgi:hypothetical protein
MVRAHPSVHPSPADEGGEKSGRKPNPNPNPNPNPDPHPHNPRRSDRLSNKSKTVTRSGNVTPNRIDFSHTTTKNSHRGSASPAPSANGSQGDKVSGIGSQAEKVSGFIGTPSPVFLSRADKTPIPATDDREKQRAKYLLAEKMKMNKKLSLLESNHLFVA